MFVVVHYMCVFMQEGEAEVSCARGSGKVTKGGSVLFKAGEK